MTGRRFTLLLCMLPMTACDRDETATTGETSTAVSASAVAPVASASAPKPQRFRIPSGPVLAILPGQGVGPIRLGATAATIERHMDRPCDERTEHLCRYYGRAVEFELDEQGQTETIVVHRLERPSGGKEPFGLFNGRFANGAQLGMLPSAIEELVGKADRVEDVQPDGPRRTEKIFHYDGMRLEFDRIENGNLVLGGVVIVRPTTSATPSDSAG